MIIKKLSVSLIVLALVSVSFGMLASDSAQAAFIQPLNSIGLPSSFTPRDTAWNEAGTMAVVAGSDSSNGPSVYFYWLSNNTYVPAPNCVPGQSMYGVDFYAEMASTGGNTSEPSVPPSVLLVDADAYDVIWPFYWNALMPTGANVYRWDVYDASGYFAQGKPNATYMNTYDVVIWICSYNMWSQYGAGDPFDMMDEWEVEAYLSGGGTFMMSNIHVSEYLEWNGGSQGYYAPGVFAYDCLGIDSVYNTWLGYEDWVEAIGSDPIYGGMGNSTLYWDQGNWGGIQPSSCDAVVNTATSHHCFRNWDNTYMFEYSALRNEVANFKTLFLGFPFEVLDSMYAQELMARTIDWFSPATESETPSSLSLNPGKDNTIYEDYPYNSNGAGEYIMAGMTNSRRRALMEFDIAGMIPSQSTITSVGLSLFCGASFDNNPRNIYLHPITQEWGEAGSDAPYPESNGTAAFIGDATWYYASYDNITFSMTGGNYSGWSANTEVSWANMWYTWGSSQMVNDVQNWLDNPSQNHGWILLGDETMGNTMKWFRSRNNVNSTTWPRLTVGYATSGGGGGGSGGSNYTETFWVCGDNAGAGMPCVYKIEPKTSLSLQNMGLTLAHPLQSISCDDSGNPMAVGESLSAQYYYDREAENWLTVGGVNLNYCYFSGVDFNPNDGRFYIAGYDGNLARPVVYYTDPVPLTLNSSCHHYQSPDLTSDCSLRAIAWNPYYNYGLAVGDEGLFLKIWSYNYSINGTMRYKKVDSSPMNNFWDISWDTDGWNEAAIVGTYSTSKMYWRYFNSNPQIIEGYNGMAGFYYTCAFKPPSSPKWLLIPYGGSGGIRVNTEEKDESHTITVTTEFPHIFNMDMWKQSDAAMVSTFNTQVPADSTYTFFIEGNYTREGSDYWDVSMNIYLQLWYDAGFIGFNSDPADMTWWSKTLRTRQVNISYTPSLGITLLNYPDPGLGVHEFEIHSLWEDPNTYGPDSSHHRLYINVTFGEQTYMAPGDGAWNSGNIWDRNTLNDPWTWDCKALLYDTVIPAAYNATYNEFGVERFGALSVSGNPAGSIPPGAQAELTTPSSITYSANSIYKLNVSIPNLLKIGNPALNIPATYVDVRNIHSTVDFTYSDIWDWTAFLGSGDQLCIWGQEFGTSVAPAGNGTVSAGPWYTNYTAADLGQAFEVTQVSWRVEVPPGTEEGVYRATITITLWS